MLTAILKNDILGFAKANELIWYDLIREPKLLTELKTEWFFELKNKNGKIITVPADEKIFRLYAIK